MLNRGFLEPDKRAMNQRASSSLIGRLAFRRGSSVPSEFRITVVTNYGDRTPDCQPAEDRKCRFQPDPSGEHPLGGLCLIGDLICPGLPLPHRALQSLAEGTSELGQGKVTLWHLPTSHVYLYCCGP